MNRQESLWSQHSSANLYYGTCDAFGKIELFEHVELWSAKSRMVHFSKTTDFVCDAPSDESAEFIANDGRTLGANI